MKCFRCGADVPMGNNFCPHCGAPMTAVSMNGYNEPMIPKQAGSGANVLAICSMIFGFVSWVFFILCGVIQMQYENSRDSFSKWFYDEPEFSTAAIVMAILYLVCSITGIVTSIIALVKKNTKKGIAITGLVCSSIIWLFIIFSIIGSLF